VNTERQTGTIKSWISRRGFGFLAKPDGGELFMHGSEWVEHDEPRRGERVAFFEGIDRNQRPFARQVTCL
jgi:cold shock CspA family protein